MKSADSQIIDILQDIRAGVVGTGIPASGSTGQASGVIPVQSFFIKNLPVNTVGAADIAQIALPGSWTRWKLFNSAAAVPPSFFFAEVQGFAAMSAANFAIYDAPGGGGNQVSALAGGPTATIVAVAWGAQVPTAIYTAKIIYIRQNAALPGGGFITLVVTPIPIP